MNAARRRRQKDNRAGHVHLNRAARTDADGTVQRCPFCAPSGQAPSSTHSTWRPSARPLMDVIGGRRD
jgi:hypothetical protein